MDSNEILSLFHTVGLLKTQLDVHPYLLLLIFPAQGKLRYHHTHGKACGYDYGVYYVLFSSNEVFIALSTGL